MVMVGKLEVGAKVKVGGLNLVGIGKVLVKEGRRGPEG